MAMLLQQHWQLQHVATGPTPPTPAPTLTSTQLIVPPPPPAALTPSLPPPAAQHYNLIEDKELAPLEELISQFQGKMAAKSSLQQLI